MFTQYWCYLVFILLISWPDWSLQEETFGSGNDTFNPTLGPTCFEISNKNAPNSLPTIASNVSHCDRSIIIQINIEAVKLTTVAEFSNVLSVTIFGNNNTIICSNSGSGIVFQFLDYVSIQNLQLRNCGVLKKNQMSGLHIISCGSIVMFDVVIACSDGSGLSIDSPKYNVSITDSHFIQSELLSQTNSTMLGGNGLKINVENHDHNGNELDIPLVITLDGCLFAKNIDKSESYSFLYGNLQGKGRGGGLYLITEESSKKIIAKITKCQFEHNIAHLGGGMSISLKGDNATDYTVTVTDTILSRNGCNNKLGTNIVGGGAFLSFENSRLTEGTRNVLHFINVTFTQNCADLGGGTFFFSNKYTTAQTGLIKFERCNWYRNKAHIGSAVLLTTNVFVRAQVGYLTTPVFESCTFEGNSIHASDTDPKTNDTMYKEYGSGTVYSSLLSIQFINTADFTNNFGSGIVIVNAEINFISSSAAFVNNTAVQGAALCLIGVSAMIIGSNENYIFENNRAYDRGGAIFVQLVDSADTVMSRSCYFRYQMEYKRIIHSSLWDSSLIFRNNIANSEGHSIFATSLLPCQVISTANNTKYEILNISDIFAPPGFIIENASTEKHISTDGTKFDNIARPLTLFPGIKKNLGITILDDLRQQTNSKIQAILPRNSSLKVTSLSSDGLHHSIKVEGLEGDSDILTLQTLGISKLRNYVTVILQKCPPGYSLDNNRTCSCDFDSYIGITKCENDTAYLQLGFWAGYITTTDGRTILATNICPLTFCQYKKEAIFEREVRLPTNHDDLDEVICGKSRTGILCATCREGYTAYYHSPLLSCYKEEPVSCKLGWLFYILSEIVPVTLIFGLVLAFNINFTSGNLNGFILFSQLQRTLNFQADGVIVYGPITQQLTRVYQIFYGFFNLDFFNIEPLSYCLWKNASVLEIICFKYATIIYSFFLVMGVIFFTKYCAARCLGRYYSISTLKNSIIHGISGFLVLCYTQTITVSFNILSRSTLVISIQETTPLNNNLTRVWFSGDLKSLGKGHLPYAIPALVVLSTVGCMPPVILICYPQLNKIVNLFKLNKVWGLRHLEYLHKLKPLFDSFQGSFKDQYRFFAGLYFFYRWLGLFIYVYSSSSIAFYITVELLAIIMLATHSVFQPYQKWYHNVLDSLMFSILLIVNGFSVLNYFLSRVDVGRKNNTVTTSGFQLFFISLPIFYLILYAIIWIIRKVLYSKYGAVLETEQFVLSKLSKKFHFNESTKIEDNDLPYRLLGHKEDVSFADCHVGPTNVNTY